MIGLKETVMIVIAAVSLNAVPIAINVRKTKQRTVNCIRALLVALSVAGSFLYNWPRKLENERRKN